MDFRYIIPKKLEKNLDKYLYNLKKVKKYGLLAEIAQIINKIAGDEKWFGYTKMRGEIEDDNKAPLK